jgi:MFS family permease
MALSNLSLFGGAFFTPVIVGKMTHSLGWPWPFYFVGIFSGVLLPMVFFLVPETSFRRPAHLNTDISSVDDFHRQQRFEGILEGRDSPGGETTPRQGSLRGPQEDTEQNHLSQSGQASLEKPPEYIGRRDPTQGEDTLLPKKVSFSRSLLPFNGRKTDESFFKLLFRPFPLFFHPAVLWVSNFCLLVFIYRTAG